MMISSYMDESFDKQPSGIFAVGGFLGKGVPVFELERGWEKLLKRDGLKFFKASRILVLMVPNGEPVLSAISEWLIPLK